MHDEMQSTVTHESVDALKRRPVPNEKSPDIRVELRFIHFEKKNNSKLVVRDKHFCLHTFLKGGTLSMEDLRSFQVQVKDAWLLSLGETRMHIPPPPAGGAVLAFILNVMKGLLCASLIDQSITILCCASLLR